MHELYRSYKDTVIEVAIDNTFRDEASRSGDYPRHSYIQFWASYPSKSKSPSVNWGLSIFITEDS